MATLYELSAGYASLLDMYDQAETEDERAEILDMLASAEGDITEKAEAYARIMKNKQAEADAFKAEADRLTAKRKAAEAGWIIGLIAGLGGFLIVVGIIGLLLIEAAKIIWPADSQKEEEETEDYG